MRVARWRLMLVSMVVVVAGCLPSTPAPTLPAGLLADIGGTRATFTAQMPPTAATGQDVVAALRAQNALGMFRGRAVPFYGIFDCHGSPSCEPVSAGTPGGASTVWVVLYPACLDADGSDPGWVVVDAVKGVDGGYIVNDQCD